MSRERGRRGRQERPLCACWSSQSPWKQWALLIWPIPLSSVNSPRQHGPYHSSCKRGRRPALQQLWGRLYNPSEPVFKIPPLDSRPNVRPLTPWSPSVLPEEPGRWLTPSAHRFPPRWLDPLCKAEPRPVALQTSNWIQALRLCCHFPVNSL